MPSVVAVAGWLISPLLSPSLIGDGFNSTSIGFFRSSFTSLLLADAAALRSATWRKMFCCCSLARSILSCSVALGVVVCIDVGVTRGMTAATLASTGTSFFSSIASEDVLSATDVVVVAAEDSVAQAFGG